MTVQNEHTPGGIWASKNTVASTLLLTQILAIDSFATRRIVFWYKMGEKTNRETRIETLKIKHEQWREGFGQK